MYSILWISAKSILFLNTCMMIEIYLSYISIIKEVTKNQKWFIVLIHFTLILANLASSNQRKTNCLMCDCTYLRRKCKNSYKCITSDYLFTTLRKDILFITYDNMLKAIQTCKRKHAF